MMVHTGDVTHLSKPEEFATAFDLLSGAKLDTHYIPGEHDVIGDDGKGFFERFDAKGAAPGGWYSWDQGGVHFVALVNVLGFTPGPAARSARRSLSGSKAISRQEREHAGCRAGTCAALADLSAMGLGDRRRGESLRLSEAVRLR